MCAYHRAEARTSRTARMGWALTLMASSSRSRERGCGKAARDAGVERRDLDAGALDGRERDAASARSLRAEVGRAHAVQRDLLDVGLERLGAGDHRRRRLEHD